MSREYYRLCWRGLGFEGRSIFLYPRYEADKKLASQERKRIEGWEWWLELEKPKNELEIYNQRFIKSLSIRRLEQLVGYLEGRRRILIHENSVGFGFTSARKKFGRENR